MDDRAEAVAGLERVRDELLGRFDHDEESFTPWALELLSITEKMLVIARNDGPVCRVCDTDGREFCTLHNDGVEEA